MLDWGESNKMMKISEKMNKSDTYNGLVVIFHFLFKEFLHNK